MFDYFFEFFKLNSSVRVNFMNKDQIIEVDFKIRFIQNGQPA